MKTALTNKPYANPYLAGIVLGIVLFAASAVTIVLGVAPWPLLEMLEEALPL